MGPIEHFEPSGFTRYQSPATATIKWAAMGGYVLLNVALVILLVAFDHIGLITGMMIAAGMAGIAALIGSMLMRPHSPQPERH